MKISNRIEPLNCTENYLEELTYKKAEELIGKEAVKLITDKGAEIILAASSAREGTKTNNAKDGEGDKENLKWLEETYVLAFETNERIVSLAQYIVSDPEKGQLVPGVVISFRFKESDTAATTNQNPFQETKPQLHNQTLAFLRFMVTFVQAVAKHTNVIILPSDERRESLYERHLTVNPPQSKYKIYIVDKSGKVKKRFGNSSQ